MNPYNTAPDRPLDPPEPKLRKVYECACCEEPIYEGEDYYYIEALEIYVCESCIDDSKRYSAEGEW